MGDDEILPSDRHARLKLFAWRCFDAALEALGQGGKSLFKLTAQHCLDT
jgi:hypothetical protein